MEWPHLVEAKAAFHRRMQNKRPLPEPPIGLQPEADAPQVAPCAAGAAAASPGAVQPLAEPGAALAGAKTPQGAPPRALVKAPPAAAFAKPLPPMQPGSSNDPVPSKPMPQLPKVLPRPARDFRYSAGAASPQLQLGMSSAQAAQGQAARLEATQRAARLEVARLDAQRLAKEKPVTPPADPLSDVVEAFIRGSQSMIGYKAANRWAPPAWYDTGKGKGEAWPADPSGGKTSKGGPQGQEEGPPLPGGPVRS